MKLTVRSIRRSSLGYEVFLAIVVMNSTCISASSIRTRRVQSKSGLWTSVKPAQANDLVHGQRNGLLVTDAARSWCVEEPGPSRCYSRSSGDRTVPGGPSGSGVDHLYRHRTARAALA